MSEDRRTTYTTPKAISEELDRRYPNDVLRVDNLKTDKEKTEYVGKLKLINEVKVMMGVK